MSFPSLADGENSLPVHSDVVSIASILSNSKPRQNWSSIIGIVTAIVGNILISFALNTQRYAHVRLDREYQRKLGNSGATSAGDKDYGTVGHNPSNDHSQAVEHGDGRPLLGGNDDEDADETHPLLSRAKEPESDNEDDTSTIRADDDSSEEPTKKNYLRSPYWWIGISLMVIGEAGNFLAYGFAPASIVSPLGVVALISNCLIAPIFLKEQFRMRDLLGVVIAVAGAVIVVLSAQGSNPRLGPNEIWSLIARWEFETYLGITIVLIIGLIAASNTSWADKTMAIDIGLVGLCGGYTALSTKGVASLLSNRLWKIVTYPVTYLLVFILVATALMQIKYVNRALQRFDATRVIPAQFVSFTIFVVLGSAVLYRDFERSTVGDAIEFLAGVILTFLGVWCITSGRDQGTTAEEDVEAMQEDTIDLVDEEAQEHETVEHDPSLKSPQYTQPPRTPQRVSQLATTPEFDSPASFATAKSNQNTPISSGRLIQIQNNSEPLLPSEVSTPLATLSHEQTPSRSTKRQSIPQRSRSNRTPRTQPSELTTTARHSISAAVPSTPANHSSHPLAAPGPSSTGRGSLSSRLSLSSGMLLFPGPIASPLSSGLSAVAADQRKRRASGQALLAHRPSASRASTAEPGSVSASAGARPRGGSAGRNLLSRTSTAPDRAAGSEGDASGGPSSPAVASTPDSERRGSARSVL